MPKILITPPFLSHFSGVFMWACVNPGQIFYLYINELISSWISAKFTSVATSPTYVCSTLWNNFQPKASTWMYLRETSTLLVDYSHNLDLFQMICIKFKCNLYWCTVAFMAACLGFWVLLCVNNSLSVCIFLFRILLLLFLGLVTYCHKSIMSLKGYCCQLVWNIQLEVRVKWQI